jgi:4-hydroxybenzoate polyprenyltransferase
MSLEQYCWSHGTTPRLGLAMHWFTRINSSLSHLTLWASLYCTGAVVCFAQISGSGLARGLDRSWALTLAYAFTTAATVYLLDRVKLRDPWLDPADEAAHPDRFGFLARCASRVRLLAAATGVASVVLGWALSPLAPLLTVGACVGVVAYAGRPRRERARIKDVFLLKNGFVAAGITAFAAVVCVMSAEQGRSRETVLRLVQENWPLLAFAGAQLFVRVFADAAVCDLDDEHADRSYRTATLPTHLGRWRAWNVAAGLRIALGIVLLATPIGPPGPRMAWGLVTIASTVLLRLWNPRRVREAVDARLALEAMVVWIVLACRAPS